MAFPYLTFATSSGKYQNKEKPLKRQRKLGLGSLVIHHAHTLRQRLLSDWADAHADVSPRLAHARFFGLVMLWLVDQDLHCAIKIMQN